MELIESEWHSLSYWGKVDHSKTWRKPQMLPGLQSPEMGLRERPTRSGLVVASLDRKRLGADCWGGAGSRIEAFSIRRLGGSRWRLRRTRCAMGFERQRGSKRGLGRAARRWCAVEHRVIDWVSRSPSRGSSK